MQNANYSSVSIPNDILKPKNTAWHVKRHSILKTANSKVIKAEELIREFTYHVSQAECTNFMKVDVDFGSIGSAGRNLTGTSYAFKLTDDGSFYITVAGPIGSVGVDCYYIGAKTKARTEAIRDALLSGHGASLSAKNDAEFQTNADKRYYANRDKIIQKGIKIGNVYMFPADENGIVSTFVVVGFDEECLVFAKNMSNGKILVTNPSKLHKTMLVSEK